MTAVFFIVWPFIFGMFVLGFFAGCWYSRRLVRDEANRVVGIVADRLKAPAPSRSWDPDVDLTPEAVAEARAFIDAGRG